MSKIFNSWDKHANQNRIIRSRIESHLDEEKIVHELENKRRSWDDSELAEVASLEMEDD